MLYFCTIAEIPVLHFSTFVIAFFLEISFFDVDHVLKLHRFVFSLARSLLLCVGFLLAMASRGYSPATGLLPAVASLAAKHRM